MKELTYLEQLIYDTGLSDAQAAIMKLAPDKTSPNFNFAKQCVDAIDLLARTTVGKAVN